MSPLTSTLWITLIGMGLVFIAILLLWGLMEALMSFSARFAVQGAEAGEMEPPEEELPVALTALETDQDQKKQAAVAAVAFALALHQRRAARPALPVTTGSAWQTVTRASQLNHPTHLTRKSRGRMR